MWTNLLVTAYCSCHICCGSHATGLTASGHKPIQGTTIAASRSLPLGTRVYLEGHWYVVQDRLSKRFDSRMDIYMSKHSDAKKHGIKLEQVWIESKRKN